jgi:hypothetical protein
MRFGALSVLSSFVLFVAGCDGCDKKPETTDSGPAVPASASASASAPASASAASPDAGAPKHDMGNCPTAVAGATVAIKDVEGGVEVTVIGKDDATTASIRERTKKLAAADRGSPEGGAKHDHSGSGGGTTGRCTIIMRNTEIATADVDKGSKITGKAKDKAEIDWVRRETKDRDKEAKAAGAEGAGAQRMANCPSAVEGAKTAVKDTKEGVLVTVTGPADKVAEIRSRAKHTADVAKKADATKIEHTGEGTGGGGLGRCPIVVEGDTTVEIKEIEGGVEVDVKSKKDAAALQKEAKARAANFASGGAAAPAPTGSATK